MKKSVCLMAILGALGATSAFAAVETTETHTVKFTGEVIASTCDLTIGGTGNVIHLGRVEPEADKKGLLVPVTFNFTNCDKKTLKKISYKGGNNGGKDNTTDGTIGTHLERVSIKLFTDAEGKNYSADVTQNIQFDPAGTTSKAIIPYYARLETAKNGGNPESGTVQSSALFAVTYQ